MQPPENPYNQPPLPNPSGDPLRPAYSGANDSGTGPTAQLPAELQGLNGGAFFLNWIWAIAHNYWLGLLALIPCVGFFVAIYMLIKGNELAWQNRRFESVEQFKEIQKKWLIWGVAIFAIAICLNVVSTILGAGAAMMAPNATTPPTFPQ